MSDELAPTYTPEEAEEAARLESMISEDAEEPSSAAAEPRPDVEPSPDDAKVDRDYEAEAREMGWLPAEEWNGDPKRHRDAKTYVEMAENDPHRLRKMYADLKTQHEEALEGLTKATRATIERERKESEERHARELKALQDQRDQAIRQSAGRPEAVVQINREYEERRQAIAQPVRSEVLEWKAIRPAFETDPIFQAAAIGGLDQVERDMPNASLPEQLKELDTRLVKRFPEYYQGQSQKRDNGAPPANSRQMSGVPVAPRRNDKGFDTLPAEARAMWKTLSEDTGITKDQFAKEYYSD